MDILKFIAILWSIANDVGMSRYCVENLQNKPVNQMILFKKKNKVGGRLLEGI